MTELERLKSELTEVAKTLAKVPKRLAFAKGLAQGKSQGKAYSDAGYNSKKPHEDANKAITRYPNIAQYRDLFQKVAHLESLPEEFASFTEKRRMLWDAAQRCMQEIEPKYEGQGEDRELVGFIFDATGMRGCIAELNKMDGDYEPTRVDMGLESLLNELTGSGEDADDG